VGEGEVDEEQPGDEEDHPGLETHAVGEGPRDQRRGDDGEHHLVNEEHEHRHALVAGDPHVDIDALEEGPVEVADDAGPVSVVQAAPAAAKAHGKANGNQMTVVRPSETKLWIMIAKTFLRPTRPP